MIRMVTYSERNITILAPRVVIVPAITAVEIFPDDSFTKIGEICVRYCQNCSDNDVYLSFGLSAANKAPLCDNIDQYHAVIKPWQLFDCSPHRRRVCAYSVAGATVSTTLMYRSDTASAQMKA